jgi:hypothetical protein
MHYRSLRLVLALASLPLLSPMLSGCPTNVVAASCTSDFDCRVGASCVAGQCRPSSGVDAFVFDAGAADTGASNTDTNASTGDDTGSLVDAFAHDVGPVDAPIPSPPDAWAPDAAVDAWAPDANADAGTLACRSPSGACDLLRQDCPNLPGGERQTCIYALNASGVSETQCAQILDEGGGLGAPCCSLNSCDPGLACMDSVGGASGACTTMGRCQRYCCGDTSTCAPGELCAPYNPDFRGGICDPVDRCDLVRQTGCETMPGTACYPSSGSDPRCLRPTAAMVAVGGTCTFTNDCVAGSTCVGLSAGVNRCSRLCDVADGTADCAAVGGLTCRTVSFLPAGIGICPIP